MNQLDDPRGPPPTARDIKREQILDIAFYVLGAAFFAALIIPIFT